MDNYVYHDRKMMKWTPFNALLEHSDYIMDLLNGRERINKPVLSPDQYFELNYRLEESYNLKSVVSVKYFDNGYLKETSGVINQVDIYNRLVFVNSTPLEVEMIVEITPLTWRNKKENQITFMI